MKALQEMSLVDDFLMNSLTSHKVYGEAASQYILECILGRTVGKLTVVPQRFLCGETGDDRAIRLDVLLDEKYAGIYDMEPDRNGSRKDLAVLPRRVRFYHAKIDSKSLAAGDDYGKLRDVVVIFITTYDPFGRDRMVYTVKNCCVEEPDIPYDDGAMTLFLYTRGTKGNPPEKLKQLLQYMEHSTAENATTRELQELHRMVTEVKQDGEVGLAYMKSFEREQRIREEGIEEGRQQGVEQGLEKGLEKGLEQGILKTCRALGVAREEAVRQLVEQCGLSEKEAAELVEKYWAAP